MNGKRIRRSKVFDPNLPTLNINERFIEACAIGDYQTVAHILETVKNFNIDITDNLGRSALRVAVSNENIDVVQVLLTKADSSKLKESLLLAIYMGHNQIAETILKHPQYKIFNDKKFLNGATDSFWQTPSSDDAQFSPDITPIMLASQYNRTEIVQLLLLNGDRIEKPHEFFCKCNECSNRFKFDSLRHAQSRLNAYRGIASESYISLTSIDPILTAFEIRRELKILAEKEKYFKGEYLSLAEKMSEYSVKLLNYVRGRDELEIMLNKTGKEKEEKYDLLARFDLALKYEEMPFVAHPNCQQKLVEVWYTGLRKIAKMNDLLVFFLIFAHILFMPIGCIIFIFRPYSKIGRFMSLPYIKFVSFTVSYLIFALMVVLSSLRFGEDYSNLERFSLAYPERFENYTSYFENKHLKYRFLVKDFYIRPINPNILDYLICLWLFGQILKEIKKNIDYGIKDYLYSWSNILTALMSVLYITSYSLKFYAYYRVKKEKENLDSEFFWTLVIHLNDTDEISQKKIFETFYWLNQDRFYWNSMDTVSLYEAINTIALIITFSKFCFWLPANQSLGPLQITLGRMISDILKFICIFTIVFSGFLFGLHNLYWYYELDVRKNVEVNPHKFSKNDTEPFLTKGEERFGTIGSALITMFFALYALGETDDVLIEPYNNQVTPNFGYILFGMFHISNITILLSMLIAMMTSSFESILEQSDIQWKFSRSKLYMEYIKEGSSLPIPFNIIPSPGSFFDLFDYFLYCVRKQRNVAKESRNFYFAKYWLKKADRSTPTGEELSFKKVSERVSKRFLLHNNRENEDVKESDFDELKQDLQMARFEMISDVRKIRENLSSYGLMFHKGLSSLCLNLNHNHPNNQKSIKLKNFLDYEDKLKAEYQEIFDSNKYHSIEKIE